MGSCFRPLALWLGLLCLGGRSGAETLWVEAASPIDPGATEALAAAKALAPIVLPGQDIFKGVRYPQMSDNGDVTFVADDAFIGDGAKHGIYRFSAAEQAIHRLVSEHDQIPGSELQYGALRGLQVDERGHDLVFSAVKGEQRGLFVWSDEGIATVARAGVTVLPGGTGPLIDVHWGALHSGRVLYTAQDEGGQSVLVLHDLKSHTNRVLVRSDEILPEHPEEPFHSIAHQNWLDANNVVFRAGEIDLDSNDKEKGRIGVYGWFHLDWNDPSAFHLNRLVTVAESEMLMPGLEGEHFTDFRSTPVHEAMVAFVGRGEKESAVCAAENGHSPQPIVDTQTKLPGLFEGHFTGFGTWPAAVENGVVFSARGPDFVGAFLYRTDEGMLYLLADSRQPLDQKIVKDFEIGSHPMNRRRVALTIKFTDGSSRVYVASVPTRGFKRLETRR